MPPIDLNTLLDLVGQLNDDPGKDSASVRFRSYLERNILTVDDVRAYVGSTLTQSGDQFNKALQDLINHIGQLLGFEVAFGRYRGVKGEIGFDGLWRSSSGLTVVVEAKTTDVYSIRTSTLLGYINSLVSEGHIPNNSNALGLYVYGRFDAGTNQLENAIIVEGRRERLRVVSVEALLQILQLKQEYNLAHKTILGLLLPAPVRVDAVVNLIFDIVAQEKEELEESIISIEEPVDEGIEEKVEQLQDTTNYSSLSLVSINESYTGRTVKTITLFKQQHTVQSWKEVTLTVFEVLRNRKPEKFNEVAPKIVGRKRPYISSEKERLRVPELIPNTTLYIETNLSANFLVRLCCTLLESMGFSKSDLRIETEE